MAVCCMGVVKRQFFMFSVTSLRSREAMTKGDLVNGSPSHGWEKINVDGSTSMVDNWSAVGGVIQDSLAN
ncbi:hypothetical protein PVK06_039260 [Gossypium arboreum]|uniref:Uncharacterized protein n=1 Tax=Gossypium arboreum TaxID=29729 RepID=A0ABR0N2E2_GOSAR|nr:hypothetical protein PVK06_039260 [Gossypium arboreum]